MSASARTPLWRHWLHRITPFLFRRCMGYNKHWAWDRACYCMVGENGHGIFLRIRGNAWIDLGPHAVHYFGPDDRTRQMIERVAQIDPENITLDTVRMLFPWMPRWSAGLILATGVRQGKFEPKNDGNFRMVKK